MPSQKSQQMHSRLYRFQMLFYKLCIAFQLLNLIILSDLSYSFNTIPVELTANVPFNSQFI